MPLFPRLRTFRIRLSLRLYRHLQSILLLTYYFRLKERSLLVTLLQMQCIPGIRPGIMSDTLRRIIKIKYM